MLTLKFWAADLLMTRFSLAVALAGYFAAV